MSWTGWGNQDGNREMPTLEAVMREQQKENEGRAPDVELPAAAECDGLAGERARHGGAQPKCDCEHLSGQGAIESSQGKKSQEEEDLALALTLQAVEEEELLLAQEQYARQLDAAKRSGTEKIRVVLPGGEGGGRTGGSALAYTKSVEAAEKMLEKTYKDYRS